MNRWIALANDMSKITKSSIYKRRYPLAIITISLLLIIILLITGLYAPNGLAQTEINSAVASHKLGFANLFEAHNIVNLPYKILQKLSINIFGLSIFSIKLPSLLIAAITAVSLFILIAAWTDRRSAILATVIILISSRWLFLSQLGDHQVATIGLSITLTSALALLTQQSNAIYQAKKRPKYYQIALVALLLTIFVSAGLLFYFPMGVYLIFIISLTMLLHPFVRLSLKRLNKLVGNTWYFVGLTCLAVSVTPLAIGLIKDGDVATNLFNLDSFNFNLFENLKFLLKEFLDFSPQQNSLFATPWFNLSAVVLIVIGVFREIRTSYKPRSSIIIMWLFAAIVINLFSQQTTILTFVPCALSLAMGLDYILISWYRIFPRNPVARFAGLVPIVILLTSLVLYNLDAYVNAYHYQPGLANQFNTDLRLLQRQLKEHKDEPVKIIASHRFNEAEFYQILAAQNQNIIVANEYDSQSSDQQIATRLARDPLNDYDINHIITSHFTQNADRFYVYKKPQK